jgi:hypothetical protein
MHLPIMSDVTCLLMFCRESKNRDVVDGGCYHSDIFVVGVAGFVEFHISLYDYNSINVATDKVFVQSKDSVSIILSAVG